MSTAHPDYECKHCEFGDDSLMVVLRHIQSEHNIGACRIADHMRCNIPVRIPRRIQPPKGWDPFGGSV